MQVNNQWNQAAVLVAAAMLTAGGVSPGASQPSTSTLKGIGPSPNLPPPQPSESATKFAKVVGWPKNLTPKAPDGFQVEAFARDLESPRWLYVLPNGDVLVSQAQSSTVERQCHEAQGHGRRREHRRVTEQNHSPSGLRQRRTG